MSKRNSLMEWLEQTKRLTKEEDYMGLDIIDTIIDYVWVIDPRMLKKKENRKMFNHLCSYYHKPNPLDYLTPRKKEQEFKKDHNGKSIAQWQSSLCSHQSGRGYRECKLYKYLRESMTEQIEKQISRYQQAVEALRRQWFEVIDFMYDRPELINPNDIDDYIEYTINLVCKEYRKNNPLTNGHRARFGKYWKDKDGNWHKEKRIRY